MGATGISIAGCSLLPSCGRSAALPWGPRDSTRTPGWEGCPPSCSPLPRSQDVHPIMSPGCDGLLVEARHLRLYSLGPPTGFYWQTQSPGGL